MADQEQVELLKRSVYEWNVWRGEHLEIRPDLSSAHLGSASIPSDYLMRQPLSLATFMYKYLENTDASRADLSRRYLSRIVLRHAYLSRANLSDAYLGGVDLSGADLSNADLSRANLNDADLSNADLKSANLSGANLSLANLSRADLSRANLDRAFLNYANLSNTHLNNANLSHAVLNGANFNQTIFTETIFAWVDLSQVKELETAAHWGPSIVNINSVILPRDESTRNHFLRGVGFTETQIEYLPSLLTPRPIEYSSLFISYSHEDEVTAKRLYSDLRKKDVPCWFAPHDLRPGTPILRGIEEAIPLQDKFLLILSKHAVNSHWIEREVDAALHQEIERGQDVLFPIRLDNAVLKSNAGWATRLQHRHIGDFTGWQNDAAYQEAFTTLLRHLKRSQTHRIRSGKRRTLPNSSRKDRIDGK